MRLNSRNAFMNSLKDKYSDYCQSIEELAFYYQDWWLDAVCYPDEWSVSFATNKSENIIAALPYMDQKKFGFRLLRQPLLTPYLGPIIKYPDNSFKTASKLSYEKKLSESLYHELGKFDYFNQHFYHRVKNVQPWYWNDFETSVRYNFHLKLDDIYDDIKAKYESKTRSHIKQATNKLNLINIDDRLKDFFELTKASFEYNNNKLPFDYKFLKRVDRALNDHKLRTIHAVVDHEDIVHAACYLVHDNGILYTLQISSDPNLRKNGAVQFLMDQIVRQYHKEYSYLDFCGTMLENVEPVFRSFGAEQVPYFQVSKHGSKSFKILSLLKSILR